ncbi:hypothetical protein [Anaerovorax odorimutans]|uniref:hypothetical protein n=1 Tax=Anaerovorax odorimutans TaxID=109327 RepID=UPI000482F57F|nr:hypothetical protein [Anaerovorax odorimutans]
MHETEFLKERMEFFATQNSYYEGAFSAVDPINVGIVSGVHGASVLEDMSDFPVPVNAENVRKKSEKELRELRLKGYKVSGNEEIVNDVGNRVWICKRHFIEHRIRPVS